MFSAFVEIVLFCTLLHQIKHLQSTNATSKAGVRRSCARDRDTLRYSLRQNGQRDPRLLMALLRTAGLEDPSKAQQKVPFS